MAKTLDEEIQVRAVFEGKVDIMLDDFVWMNPCDEEL